MKTLRFFWLPMFLFIVMVPLFAALLLPGCSGDDDDDDDDETGDTTLTCTVDEFCVYHGQCTQSETSEEMCYEDMHWRLEGEDARCPHDAFVACLCECMKLECADYADPYNWCSSQCDEDLCEQQSAQTK